MESGPRADCNRRDTFAILFWCGNPNGERLTPLQTSQKLSCCTERRQDIFESGFNSLGPKLQYMNSTCLSSHCCFAGRGRTSPTGSARNHREAGSGENHRPRGAPCAAATASEGHSTAGPAPEEGHRGAAATATAAGESSAGRTTTGAGGATGSRAACTSTGAGTAPRGHGAAPTPATAYRCTSPAPAPARAYLC